MACAGLGTACACSRECGHAVNTSCNTLPCVNWHKALHICKVGGRRSFWFRTFELNLWSTTIATAFAPCCRCCPHCSLCCQLCPPGPAVAGAGAEARDAVAQLSRRQQKVAGVGVAEAGAGAAAGAGAGANRPTGRQLHKAWQVRKTFWAARMMRPAVMRQVARQARVRQAC